MKKGEAGHIESDERTIISNHTSYDKTSVFIRKDLISIGTIIQNTIKKLKEGAMNLEGILGTSVAEGAGEEEKEEAEEAAEAAEAAAEEGCEVVDTKGILVKAAEDLKKKFNDLIAPFFTRMMEIIKIIEHFKTKISETIPESDPGLTTYYRNTADAYWCLLLIFIYLYQ